MKRVLLSLVGLLAVFLPTAAKADVSLGANFGASFVIPKKGVNELVVGWPMSSVGNLPGIRVGFELADQGKHELYLDTTVFAQGSPNTKYALVAIAYQHNFAPRDPNTFYFTAGGGPVISIQSGQDDVRFMAGGGVGFRQRVSQGYGTFREELRADFLTASDHYQSQFLISLKFGFDLWFR